MNKHIFLLLAMALATTLVFGFQMTFADTASGNVTITNAAPTMPGLVTLWNQNGADDVIGLSVTGATVTANVTVTDTNGGGNVASAIGKLYHSTNTSADVDNENVHLTNSSCALGAANGNDRVATCSFTLGYMALNGTWTVNITATDLGGDSVSKTDDNTVSTHVGMAITQAVIEFGDMALGTNTTSTKTMTIQNLGNVQMDVQLKGTNYTCTTGTIPATNTKYGLTGANYDALGTGLTEVDATHSAFDLMYRNAGVDKTKDELWGILIPTSGVSGTCNNTITVTVIEG